MQATKKLENKSNDKKCKANENYAFDDDVFDHFSIDGMTSSIKMMKILRILMNRKQAVALCMMNQIL
jgi:hypothetical protein